MIRKEKWKETRQEAMRKDNVDQRPSNKVIEGTKGMKLNVQKSKTDQICKV